YAMFQQGSDAFVFGRIPYKKEDQLNENEQVEEKGVSLFTALKQIKDNDDKIKTALDRRVTALLATTNAASAINSINHLVNILKGKNLVKKVDFAQL
ncbi:type I-E CRISPR-associated protein Cse2/CasB, partial [Streptomyces brasiliscabiei]